MGNERTFTHNLWAAVETVEQEGNDMSSFHYLLSHPLRDFFKTLFPREFLCPRRVKCLRDRTEILLSEGDLKKKDVVDKS